MKVINIRVTDKIQLLGVKEGESILNANMPLKIAEGNYKSVILNFEFASTTWTEKLLTKYATFKIGETKKVQVELKSLEGYSNACFVPYEVFQGNCKVEVGVYGISKTDGNMEKIVSSEVVKMLIVDGSYNEKLRESQDISKVNAERLERAIADLTLVVNDKVSKEIGKGLSTNDFTNTYKSNVDSNTTARHTHSNKEVLDGTTASFKTADKTKLDGIELNAQVNKIEKIIVNGTEQTITDKTIRIQAIAGQDGADGQDGYTPIRGTDYWTQEDINIIEQYCTNYIDENITQALGGSY